LQSTGTVTPARSRSMVPSPVIPSVRWQAAICVRLAGSQGCDRAGRVITSARPGAGRNRSVWALSCGQRTINVGTDRMPGILSRSLPRCVRRKQPTLPWKQLAKGRWRLLHMGDCLMQQLSDCPCLRTLRQAQEPRAFATCAVGVETPWIDVFQYLPLSMRVPGWLGDTRQDLECACS
jgi:hypothetical protein